MPDRGWLRRDDRSFLANIDVEALMEREALIKAGASRPSVKSEIIASANPRRQVLVFYWKGWTDSASSLGWASIQSDPFGDEESLRLLYAEFAEEEVALANEGLAEFRQSMSEYDGE
jgi:hypothetical protein